MSRTDRDGDGVVRFHTDFKDLFFHDYFKIFKKSDLEKKEPTNNLTQRIKSPNPKNTSTNFNSMNKTSLYNMSAYSKSTTKLTKTPIKTKSNKKVGLNYKTPSRSSKSIDKVNNRYNGYKSNQLKESKSNYEYERKTLSNVSILDPYENTSPTRNKLNSSRADKYYSPSSRGRLSPRSPRRDIEESGTNFYSSSYNHKVRIPDLDYIPRSPDNPKFDSNSPEVFARF